MYLKRIPKHLYGVGLRRSLVGGCLLLVFGKTAVQITYHHHVCFFLSSVISINRNENNNETLFEWFDAFVNFSNHNVEMGTIRMEKRTDEAWCLIYHLALLIISPLSNVWNNKADRTWNRLHHKMVGGASAGMWNDLMMEPCCRPILKWRIFYILFLIVTLLHLWISW